MFDLLIGKVFQWYKNCSATCFMLLTSCSTSTGAPTKLTSNFNGSLSAWIESIKFISPADFNVYKLVGLGHGTRSNFLSPNKTHHFYVHVHYHLL